MLILLTLINCKGASKKKVVTLLASGFWPLGVGGLSESIKKGKFVTKSFFSDNVEEVLKICEK